MEAQTETASRLLDLPEELVNHVLTYLPWQDLVACNQACRKLNRISKESLMWRRHCLEDYRYWNGEGNLKSLKTAPPASVQWKQIFANRKTQDHALDRLLESVLDSGTGRTKKMHDSITTGYDAKDNLLRHINVNDDADDVLSRRYWATEMLGSIERSEALEEWVKLASGEPVPLERALGAFDLFVAVKPPLTLDEISDHLEFIAEQFRSDPRNVSFDSINPFDKARMLCAWLHGMNYTGLEDHGAFRELRNILLGVVLCEKDHPSLPIISVAIYCAVAQRLGIDANPCGYPGKVLAVVNAEDTYPESSQGPGAIYLDPHDGANESSLGRLKNQLSGWGIPPNQHAEFLQPATTISIVKRVARNMTESLRERPEYADALEHADPDALRLQARQSLTTSLYPSRASYAICWADLIFPDTHTQNMLNLRIPLTRVLSHIQHNHRQDIFLLHQLTPKFPELLDPRSVNDIAQGILEDDARVPIPQRRSDHASAEGNRLKFRVGQAMKHRRYGYTGAITGWDPQCMAGANWISQMNVDGLDRGRDQPFYHVIVAGDESTRYVAEENIDANADGLDEAPEGLDKVAGEFFKRWDSDNRCYVSNVRDVYPED